MSAAARDEIQQVAERSEPGITIDEFKAALRNHPAGVAVVTANGPDGPVGLTLSSVISVSAEPPMLVFSLSAGSRSTPVIAAADTVIVHLLGAGQVDLARTFATPGIDRFAVSQWTRMITGEPALPEAPVRMRARIVETMTVGGSVVVAVTILQAHAPAESETHEAPLVYHNRTWHQLNQHSSLA